jgi:hypothetical protein
LALESDLIGALIALRDGGQPAGEAAGNFDDWVNALESNPLWQEQGLFFEALLAQVIRGEAQASHPLAKMGAHLAELMKSTKAPKQAPILVDLARCRIVDSRSGEQIISEPLSRALDLLQRKGSVAIEAVMLECFGIRSYDTLVHQTKVNNLLQRLKKLSGSRLHFRTKSGFMLAEGSWEQFEIVRPTEVACKLLDAAEWKTILQGRKAEAASTEKNRTTGQILKTSVELKGQWKGELTRAEVEAQIQRPRSTTNRLLASWEKAGKISRVGTGRAVRYRWNSDVSDVSKLRTAKV